jgi:hypothetical protein
MSMVLGICLALVEASGQMASQWRSMCKSGKWHMGERNSGKASGSLITTHSYGN